MGGVFINYRREDSQDAVQRIYDQLTRTLGQRAIFRDLDTIQVGADFGEFIEAYIQHSSVMLVVIGRRWLKIRNASGVRRLDAPDDYVRYEIESGLRNGVRMVPLLVDGATMPPQSSMPASIRSICSVNAAQLHSGARFESDMNQLVPLLREMMYDMTPARGVVRAVGVKTRSLFREHGPLASGGSLHAGYDMQVRFLDPRTNREKTIWITDDKRFKVGDPVKIRINMSAFFLWRAWELDE